MSKLFATVIKDHVGKVISSLSETHACHFIESRKTNPDIVSRNKLIADIEREADIVIFKLPPERTSLKWGEAVCDADEMLYDLAKEVSAKQMTMRRSVEIKRLLLLLRPIYSIIQHCKETNTTYILEAWVPQGLEKEISGCINEASEGKSVVIYSRPLEDDKPPTLLSNPGMMKPFEELVWNYGLPSYNEIDPTCIIFFTFPAIFGMMYGDVGHGIILFILSAEIFLSKKYTFMRTFSNYGVILMFCALWSTFFGFMYGEFFGSKFQPMWLSPSENIIYFIFLSVIVGVAHLILGFLIRTVNLLKRKKLSKAVFQIQWIIFSISSVLFYTRFMNLGFELFLESLLKLVVLPGLCLVIGGILINSIEGKNSISGGLVPVYVGIESAMHLMSYMRLVIMATAHSAISATIIIVSSTYSQSSILGGIITVVLIILVETFVVFIQALRLHWVEWFYIFFKGKGDKFMPFSM